MLNECVYVGPGAQQNQAANRGEIPAVVDPDLTIGVYQGHRDFNVIERYVLQFCIICVILAEEPV